MAKPTRPTDLRKPDFSNACSLASKSIRRARRVAGLQKTGKKDYNSAPSAGDESHGMDEPG
ncbi:MAG: hypothetical protein V4454_21575 [Pseudomonadota bacterium]